jgi:hypothetical protein
MRLPRLGGVKLILVTFCTPPVGPDHRNGELVVIVADPELCAYVTFPVTAEYENTPTPVVTVFKELTNVATLA